MKSDDVFIESLGKSQMCVSAVAAWMAKRGCDVAIRPTVVRPDFDSRQDFIDGGDIEIRQRVEVKQRSIDFTSQDDYPYPTVIVDERFKVDRIPRGRLWGYLIVNNSGTHACCIKPESKGQWLTETRFDRKDGQQREFYVCPKHLCLFLGLE